ncbi:MAG: hypothetical protein JST00_29850 [Deltaproteobacteria bacterium]|nr:hypothetical protein [Deltaproteobacteria bacterium]
MTHYQSSRAVRFSAIAIAAVATACAAPTTTDTEESEAALTPRGATSSPSEDACALLNSTAQVEGLLRRCGIKGERNAKAATCFSTSGQDLTDSQNCESCTSTKPENVCSIDTTVSGTSGTEVTFTVGSKKVVCPKGSSFTQRTSLSASKESSRFASKPGGRGKDDAYTYYATVITVETESVYDFTGCVVDGATTQASVSLSCSANGGKYATTATRDGAACSEPIVDAPQRTDSM